MNDLDIQSSPKVQIDPVCDELFEKFLGSWTGEPTGKLANRHELDVTFEPVPSGRVLLERWSFTHPSGEVLLENTNYTIQDPWFEKKRPFGLASSSGMVGYWQVNPAGERCNLKGDARLTRKLMGDDQFLGRWHFKSEAGIWQNGNYNIEMRRVSR